MCARPTLVDEGRLKNLEKNPPHVIKTCSALRKWVSEQKAKGYELGLVPTMGALHAGHGALISACRARVDRVMVSVFVNPRQFAPGEDFLQYPRQLDQDAAFAQQCGADLIFAPEPSEIYASNFQAFVGLGEDYSGVLEGADRPGHFNGVCLVVLILLNLCSADVAFFGMKDYQQVVVLSKFLGDICHPCSLEVLPTVREADGLALSSRNVYLTPEGRRCAAILPQALGQVASAFLAGERSVPALVGLVRNVLARESSIETKYVRCFDFQTLRECNGVADEAAFLVTAVVRFAGTSDGDIRSVRLLDNLILSTREPWRTELQSLADRLTEARGEKHV